MARRKNRATIPADMGKKAGPIGAKIKELRDKRGMTQEALAQEAGVGRITIANLESGQAVDASTRILRKIAGALVVNLSDLAVDEGELVDMEPAIQAFLASPYGQITQPTKEELAVLRSQRKSMWVDWKPTPKRLRLLILALRDDQASE